MLNIETVKLLIDMNDLKFIKRSLFMSQKQFTLPNTFQNHCFFCSYNITALINRDNFKREVI